jgi:hypothetical protein
MHGDDWVQKLCMWYEQPRDSRILTLSSRSGFGVLLDLGTPTLELTVVASSCTV